MGGMGPAAGMNDYPCCGAHINTRGNASPLRIPIRGGKTIHATPQQLAARHHVHPPPHLSLPTSVAWLHRSCASPHRKSLAGSRGSCVAGWLAWRRVLGWTGAHSPSRGHFGGVSLTEAGCQIGAPAHRCPGTLTLYATASLVCRVCIDGLPPRSPSLIERVWTLGRRQPESEQVTAWGRRSVVAIASGRSGKSG